MRKTRLGDAKTLALLPANKASKFRGLAPGDEKEHSYFVICLPTEFTATPLHDLESTGDVVMFCISSSPRFSKLQKLVMAGKSL